MPENRSAGTRRRGTVAGRRSGRASLSALLAGAVVAAAMVAGCAKQTSDDTPPAPAAATGFKDLRESNPEWLTQQHRNGSLTYPMSPPVGGDHNPRWQNCNGDIYDAPIAPEHAVHSLEHGAVWVTYRPDLPAAEVEALADRVRDRSFLFLSPYPGLDAPISLQAWGFQLKVNSASDKRIDDFIKAYRQVATLEPGAPCSGGVTRTGTKPVLPG
jgi:hypothetical protein